MRRDTANDGAAACDVAIFGGGAAGLWLLDRLVARGLSAVLFEASDLGAGQTIASQGIIHGGLKYTLQGLLTTSAENIAAMPGLWRDCLRGRREPNLSQTRVRAEHCHLWRTDSFASRMGMIGARFGLRVAPKSLDADERPAVLSHCPGDVARLDEPVISPASLLENLASRHAGRIGRIDAAAGLRFDMGSGGVERIRLSCAADSSETAASMDIAPRHVVFTAGAGNARLRELVGLSPQAMQRRPLHMVLVRGALPVLNGHCVDGAKTRVTITSDVDSHGRAVWQVGGQIAEDGVALTSSALAERARHELEDAIPRLDLSAAEFATCRVDRAEATTPGGRRPDAHQLLHEGNVLTAWPTKLVLAPVLADAVVSLVARTAAPPGPPLTIPSGWPRPNVAAPPWETATEWRRVVAPRRRAA